MLKTITQTELLHMNMDRDANDLASTDDSDPRWQFFGQTRDFLYPLERVCGSEKDIDRMRSNGGGCAVHWAGVVAGAACLVTAGLLL
jgi:hypothetical protein